MSQIKKIESKIEQTKNELITLGPIRPGSLSKQYNVCGSPNCQCKDPVKPKKHGPYYNLSYTWKGKGKTEFIKADYLSEIELQTKNYKKMKTLVDKWIELSLELAAIKKKQRS